MTARESEVQAAQLAVDLGTAVSQAYYEAAGATPGVGLQVALPSVADSLGRLPQGEGFDLPASAPALRPVQRPKLVPNYGSEPVGGSGFQQAGVQWPAGTAPSQAYSRSSAIAYVSPGGSTPARPALAKTVRARIRSARRTLLGK